MAFDVEMFDLLKDTVSRFVKEILVPSEDLVEENNEVPLEIINKMQDMGLFGLSIPEEYGGLGLSMRQECEVAYILGQTALAFRSVIGTNVGIGSQGILIDGTLEQKNYYLPLIANGEIIVSFALTEPDAGSDAAAIRTKAIPVDGGYKINGTKRFITNASRANLITLMARTGDKGAAGISAFIVPMDLPGISLGKPYKKMGQRGTDTCDINFDDVYISDKQIIGREPNKGFYTAMKVLDRGRLHIAAIACGMAYRIISESINYAKERKQFGQPIGNFQLIQALLADSQAELLAAKSLLMATADNYDNNKLNERDQKLSMEVSCAKMFATEIVGRIADRGVQIHGGSGYVSDYKIERFYRDVRLLRLYEGTTQIQQILIGKYLTRDI